jgi:hypothetical protein
MLATGSPPRKRQVSETYAACADREARLTGDDREKAGEGLLGRWR